MRQPRLRGSRLNRSPRAGVDLGRCRGFQGHPEAALAQEERCRLRSGRSTKHSGRPLSAPSADSRAAQPQPACGGAKRHEHCAKNFFPKAVAEFRLEHMDSTCVRARHTGCCWYVVGESGVRLRWRMAVAVVPRGRGAAPAGAARSSIGPRGHRCRGGCFSCHSSCGGSVMSHGAALSCASNHSAVSTRLADQPERSHTETRASMWNRPRWRSGT